MGNDLDGFECTEDDEGKMVCQGEDDEGVCEAILVPDGHGGFKAKRKGGNPDTCKKLDKLIEQQT